MAKPKLALVGAQTLLGREVRELATAFEVHAMDSTDDEGKTLVRDADELALMSPIDQSLVEAAHLVVLAGDLESTAKVRKMRSKGIIDLTGLLEIDPNARLRSPLSEAPSKNPVPAPIDVIAHPAASMLALFLSSLQAVSPISRSVINVFHPASEFGTAGITELQQQTVSLLSFQSLNQQVFDTQAAFALLARLGEEAAHDLQRIEQRVTTNLAKLLRSTLPLPSLRLCQAPVFHGLSASVWAEFTHVPDLDRISTYLAKAGLDVREPGLDPPNNVGMANQDGVAVGAMEVDAQNPRAAWFWLAADNHRLTGQNAILVAKERTQA